MLPSFITTAPVIPSAAGSLADGACEAASGTLEDGRSPAEAASVLRRPVLRGGLFCLRRGLRFLRLTGLGGVLWILLFSLRTASCECGAEHQNGNQHQCHDSLLHTNLPPIYLRPWISNRSLYISYTKSIKTTTGKPQFHPGNLRQIRPILWEFSTIFSLRTYKNDLPHV